MGVLGVKLFVPILSGLIIKSKRERVQSQNKNFSEYEILRHFIPQDLGNKKTPFKKRMFSFSKHESGKNYLPI